MKCTEVFSAVCIATLLIGSSVFGEKYYSFNEPRALTLKKNVVLVEMKDKSAKLQKTDVENNRFDGSVERVDDYGKRFSKVKVHADKREKAVRELKTLGNVKSVYPVYENVDGLEMALTDRIVVMFKNGYADGEIGNLISIKDLKIISKRKNRYVLEVPENTSALDMANKIMEEGNAVYSHPDFICEPELFAHIPNDEYFGWQWNFHNIGQTLPNEGHVCTADADIDAPEAWDITRGSSDVIVAVLDQGVTDNHPDMPNTRQIRLPGSNFGAGNPNDPSPDANNNHGNACAGLVGASQDNNQGVTGIAPNIRIMPMRTSASGVSVSEKADAFYLAADSGADVISCSWGWTVTDTNLYPDIVTAIDSVRTSGRNGKGCIVVFAASNSADKAAGDSGFVAFPANALGDGIITVGSSNRMDSVANYSPINNRIDIVAPSHHAYPSQIPNEDFEIWTMDIPGDSGYNFLDGDSLPISGTNFLSYTGRMGGTSAACPQVAGTAALLLSIDSNLTQQEVFDILTGTADKIGGYAYSYGRCDETGYGRLNAFAAVSSQSDVGDVFGFEDAGLWRFIFGTTGTLSNNTYLKTQGSASMQIAGNGWQQIQCVNLNTAQINETSSVLRLDIFVGRNQPNPWWIGQAQMYINCPSAGIYNQYIGAVELTGLPRGVFSTISFNLPTNVMTVLAGTYTDFSFSIALNTNPRSGPYYFDNMRF